MRSGSGKAHAIFVREADNTAPHFHYFRSSLGDVMADARTDFDHGLMHLRLNTFLEYKPALLNDFGGDVGAQIPGFGIDDLILLFNADSEAWLHVITLEAGGRESFSLRKIGRAIFGMISFNAMRHRREFLRFLAASPLLTGLPVIGADNSEIIAGPMDALNVMDFEAAARKAVPPAHFGYMATGVDDDLTLKANRDGYQRIQLRPRRMVDVRTADLKVELFGQRWETPIFICPCGSQKAFHAEGELATASAVARSRNTPANTLHSHDNSHR